MEYESLLQQLTACKQEEEARGALASFVQGVRYQANYLRSCNNLNVYCLHRIKQILMLTMIQINVKR